MSLSGLNNTAVIVIGLTCLVLINSQKWRWQIGALGVIYLCEFILVSNSWPIDLAAVKLVAGWMAASILGVSRFNNPDEVKIDIEVGSTFRMATALLVFLTVGSTVPRTLTWIPALNIYQAWGGFLLIGLGLLVLGFYSYGPRVIYGLLMAIAGFEIVYAVVEVSTLVATLVALVTIGIALCGAYLIGNSDVKEQA